MAVGSPPLTRGIPLLIHYVNDQLRFTPAHAGNTLQQDLLYGGNEFTPAHAGNTLLSS